MKSYNINRTKHSFFTKFHTLQHLDSIQHNTMKKKLHITIEIRPKTYEFKHQLFSNVYLLHPGLDFRFPGFVVDAPFLSLTRPLCSGIRFFRRSRRLTHNKMADWPLRRAHGQMPWNSQNPKSKILLNFIPPSWGFGKRHEQGIAIHWKKKKHTHTHTVINYARFNRVFFWIIESNNI